MTKHQPYPPTPFYDRLTLLSKLEDGWLNGEGKAPTLEALRQASLLGPALPQAVTLYVYPTEGGGVSLEWADRYGAHEIEVMPDGLLSLMTVEQEASRTLEELQAQMQGLQAMLEDELGAKRIAAGAADRFRDVVCEALGYTDENPGDDVLVEKLREHFGKSGPEPTAWRDRMTGYEAVRDQINAAARERRR